MMITVLPRTVKPVQDIQQLAEVIEMKYCGGLVQHVKRLPVWRLRELRARD